MQQQHSHGEQRGAVRRAQEETVRTELHRTPLYHQDGSTVTPTPQPPSSPGQGPAQPVPSDCCGSGHSADTSPKLSFPATRTTRAFSLSAPTGSDRHFSVNTEWQLALNTSETTTLWDKCYYTHLNDNETKAEKLSHLSKVSRLLNNRSGTESSVDLDSVSFNYKVLRNYHLLALSCAALSGGPWLVKFPCNSAQYLTNKNHSKTFSSQLPPHYLTFSAL